MKKVISVFLILLSVSSCNSKHPLDALEYVKYMENDKNDYKVKQVIGINEYIIQLATPEYVACKELDAKQSSSADLKKRVGELQGFLFFLIKISETEESRKLSGGIRESQQQLDVNRMVSYYDQQAVMDIQLKNGSKTLKPLTYVFENNYGLAPHNTIVVGFEVAQIGESITLTFNDQYKDISSINASFNKSVLAELPKLNLNN